MSQYQRIVCEYILEEAFSDIVKDVGSFLIKNGAQKLIDLTKSLKLKRTEIIKALVILIHHSLVTYKIHKSNVIYELIIDNVLRRALFPNYTITAKEVGGNIGETIIEDLLIQGQSSMSQVIARVVLHLNDEENSNEQKLLENVKKQFVTLVDAHFIQRVTTPTTELGTDTPTLAVPLSDQYKVPMELGVSNLLTKNRRKREREEEQNDDLPVSKKSKSGTEENKETESIPDADVLWYINIEQFHLHYRQQAIIDEVRSRIDPISATIMNVLLNMSVKSDAPLYSHESSEVFLPRIQASLPQSLSLSDQELKEYMSVLTQDEFVREEGTSGGGSYTVNFKKTSEILCQTLVEQIVRERFDDKHLRLFRLLSLKKRLEQKQISDMAFIENKLAKEMLYSLLAEQFVTLQAVPRSNDYAPSRTFHLFSVELPIIARLLLQRCYKGLGNLMQSRKHETTENKRLLDKYKLWQRQQEVSEDGIEDVLTPVERDITEKVLQKIAKLEASELQLMSSIQCLEDYIGYVTANND